MNEQCPYEGRLELTWTNKHLSLLAHEDGTYEWLSRSDYRVAETRLLHDVGTVGETQPDSVRATDNLLIRGDALYALTSLARLPEFSREYGGKVKLAYFDPPFNTQQAFAHYDDALEHSVWLTMMRDRLVQTKALLAPEGSIWVHCDDVEQARLRILMDEVFGADRFVSTIVWQKRYSRDNRPAIGTVHDYIIVFAPKGGGWKEHRNRVERDAKSAAHYRNPNDDPKGPWRPIPMDAQGYRPNQMYEIVTPAGVRHLPPKGRCWSMIRERYEEMLTAGRIYFGKDNRGRPNVIRYLSEDEGLVPWTWWTSNEVGHNDEAKKEILTLFPNIPAFDTPKPERLMHRIISIATDPGDIVLDCFLGSGTTAAVAQKLDRRWVGVEWSPETVATFTRPRLELVVNGGDQGGVTKACGWAGGSSFRVLDVAPSMFAASDGMVFLAEWATNTALGEATAAQLGYEFEPDLPFCGRKGRTRLAVIDGLVNVDVVQLLVDRLMEKERLLVCGTAVEDEASTVLRDSGKGSIRKIPAAILRYYERPSKLRALLEVAPSGGSDRTIPQPEAVA